MNRRTFTDEVLDDRMAELLRAKTPAARLAIAFGLCTFAQRLIRANLEREHPDWPATTLERAIARRMSHGAV